MYINVQHTVKSVISICMKCTIEDGSCLNSGASIQATILKLSSARQTATMGCGEETVPMNHDK